MTNLTMRVNVGDPDVAFGDTGADYVDMNLSLDYLIWTAGSSAVADGQDEPTSDELNQAYSIIDDSNPVTVAYCLLFDYSAGLLDEVEGMGENKQYVFCFSFDGATASEPQLEAWDDDGHDSIDKNVLGIETGVDSFVKAKATTLTLPGAGWTGTNLAGSNVVLLNHGNGALSDLATGETSQELYANIKIVIPTDYDTPAIETFVLTIRYTWL